MKRLQRCAVFAAGVLAALPAAALAPIPYKQEGAGAAASLGNSALAVLGLSAIAIGVVLYLRKRLKLDVRADPASALLNVLETRRLGPRTLLSVVEFGGQHYLVAQGEHGVSCLAQASPREKP